MQLSAIVLHDHLYRGASRSSLGGKPKSRFLRINAIAIAAPAVTTGHDPPAIGEVDHREAADLWGHGFAPADGYSAEAARRHITFELLTFASCQPRPEQEIERHISARLRIGTVERATGCASRRQVREFRLRRW